MNKVVKSNNWANWKNKLQRLVSIVALFSLFIIVGQVKTYPHIPLKNVFKVLKIDDIGFAHACIITL